MKARVIASAFFAFVGLHNFFAASNDNQLLLSRALDLLKSKWNDVSVKYDLESENVTRTITISKIASQARLVNVKAKGNCGFVIFAGDDVNSPTIGYGLTDTLNIDNLPPAAEEFISHYSEVATKSINNNWQTGNTYPYPTINPVEPFIKTKWGQGEPFNRNCPLYHGARAVTGCCATAIGQVLHYYRADNFNDFTLEYADEISSEEVSINYSTKHFDYDNMLNEYTHDNYSELQTAAVAEMMYAAGAAAKTSWTNITSSGQWPLVALDKYFNFNATFLIRQALPTGFWMKKIQENIAAKKPILYSGKGVSNSKWSDHIFILDGIDENNYVHVNWGWSGSADGYYDISFCHPSDFDISEDGYYKNQQMICDITPRAVGETYAEKFICTSGSPIYHNNIWDSNECSHLYGKFVGYTTNSYDDISAYTAKIVAVQRYISVVGGVGYIYSPISELEHYYLKQFPNWGYVSWDAYCKTNSAYPPASYLDNGEYELMIATYDYESDRFILAEPLPMRPYFIIKNNVFSEFGYKDYPEGKASSYDETQTLSLDEFTPLTEVIAKAPFVVRIRSHSLATAIDNNEVKSSNLFFTNIDTGNIYRSSNSVTLYDLTYNGLYYEGYAMINPPTNDKNGFKMPAGRYKVTAEDSRVVITDPIYIDVDEVVDYPVLQYDIYGSLMLDDWNDSYYSKKWGDNVQIRRNANYDILVSSNNCYSPVKINLYTRKPNEDKSKEILISTFDFDPNVGFSAFTTDLPGNLYPLEGEFMFYMRYLTPNGEKDILPINTSKLNELYGNYEFMNKPTLHHILPDDSAGLPMIEVCDVEINGNTLCFKAKNIAANSFAGNVCVRMCDPENGTIAEYLVENVTLAVAEQKSLSVDVAIEEGCGYETYILSVSGNTRSRADYTLATKEDSSVAHYRLGAPAAVEEVVGGSVSVFVNNGDIYIIGAKEDAIVDVYTIDGVKIVSTTGNRVANLSCGIYIVRIDNLSFKVVI